MLMAFALVFSACTNVNDPDPDPKPGEKVTIYSENFGTDLTGTAPATGWPLITNYTLFQKDGKGAAAVTYASEGGTVSIRGNQPSSAYTGASGTNNAMIAAGGGSLVIKNIATCGAKKLALSFGSIVVSDTLTIQYRVSGTTVWNPVVYKKDKSGWGLVENVEIVLPTGTNTINLKFTAAKTQYGTRVDDISISTEDAITAAVVDNDGSNPTGGDGLSLCGDTTTPLTTLIEDFDDVINNADVALTGWRVVMQTGDRNWQGKVFTSGASTETYAQATAHNGASANYESWLITPPLNIDAAASKKLSFKTAKAYWMPTSSLKVYVLKCDGDKTTQTELTTAYIAKESDTDHAFVSSGNIDLSAFTGKIYIGFKYVALGGPSNSTTFKVDDVWFNNSATSVAFGTQPITSTYVAKPYEYAISTTVMNGTGLTIITANGLPTWATLTDNGNGTAKISGTPTAVGSHEITLKASNNGVTATQTFTLSVTVAPVTGDNLLKNGSFETWADGKPTDWTLLSSTVTGTVNTAEKVIFSAGTTSFKLDASAASGTVNWSQAVNIVGGKKYKLSMSYYILSGDGTDARIWSNFKKGDAFYTDAELTAVNLFSAFKGPGNENASGTSYLPDEKGAWKNYTTDFTAPADVTGFDFQFRTYKGAIVYWDNFSLVEVQ